MSTAPNPLAIDKIPLSPKRPVEMQVLVLGLSRTGTYSMSDALEQLGYKAYHMKEVFANFKANHVEYWHEALSCKYYNRSRQYGKAELDKVLGRYSAITDAPCVIFSEELLAAYPDAKVILTNRDPDKWLKSMEASYYRILGWRYWHWLAAVDRALIGPYTEILTFVLSFWTQGEPFNRVKLRQGYLEHYEHIRSVVPASNLLEFRAEDGWAPLCTFLGKDIPDGPYPKVNQGSNTADLHWWAIWIRLAVVLGKYLGAAGAVLVAVGAVWWVSGGKGVLR